MVKIQDSGASCCEGRGGGYPVAECALKSPNWGGGLCLAAPNMPGLVQCVRRSLSHQFSCCFQRAESGDDADSAPRMTSPYLSVPVLMGRPRKPRIKMEVVMLLQGQDLPRVTTLDALSISCFSISRLFSCLCLLVSFQGRESRASPPSSNRCASSTVPAIRTKTSGALSSLSIKTSSWPCKA